MNAIDPTATISPHARIHTRRLSVGRHSRIDDGVILTGDIAIGDYVHIGAYCVLTGGAGIEIGDYTGIAAFVSILTGSDDFSGRSMCGPTIPERFKPGLTTRPTKLGSNVLVGSHCTIMPGANLGDGCAIGAHSLVKFTCDTNTLNMGVPARFVKMREMQMWSFADQLEAEERAAA